MAHVGAAGCMDHGPSTELFTKSDVALSLQSMTSGCSNLSEEDVIVVRTVLLGLGAGLSLILAACESTVEQVGTGGQAGASASSSTTSSTGPSGGGSGAMCGGFAGAGCPSGEFCDYTDNQCGSADGGGVCVQIPESCTKELVPTCGCDGKIYDNACLGYAKGVDVAHHGCKPPSGSFQCGAQFCQTGAAYCQRSVSDVGGEPDGYSCRPLPSSCGGKPSCACLASEPCSEFCELTADGGVELTCPGG